MPIFLSQPCVFSIEGIMLTLGQFRNSYDNDAVTYSPTGRLYQVEYALEAVKQGSASVGLVSKTHAVLVALKVSLNNGNNDPK